MKYSLIAICCLCAAFFACKPDAKNAANAAGASLANLSGHWIAMDFCSRAAQYGSVLASMNNGSKPYAYTVSFDPNVPDSAACYNGMESWKIPVKINKDTIELVGAVQGKSVFMVYNAQSPEQMRDMNMFDATAGTVKLDRFVKSKAETKDGGVAFMLALNHQLLQGNFSLKGSPVLFDPTGTVKGLAGFDHYSLCSAGDCFAAGQEIDVVSLSKGKDAAQLFGYRYNKTNDTLRLYNLVQQNADEKGTAKVGGLAYTLPRKVK